MYGDKGSPCCMPLVGLKYSVGFPLISMEVEDVVTQDIMRLIKFVETLRATKEQCMNDHSSWSNAFSRSNLRRMQGVLPFIFQNLDIIFWIIMALFVALRFFSKLACVG